MVLESKALALEKNGVQSFSFGDKVQRMTGR